MRKKNGKAYMECEGDVFVLDDPQQVAAVLNEKVTLIVPDASGISFLRENALIWDGSENRAYRRALILPDFKRR